MSRSVLLVDTDVDALGVLASALRARGLQVANAADAFEAVEQAFQSRPDVVLVEGRLDDDQDLVRAFEVVPELSDIPVLRLVRRDRVEDLEPGEVLRSDVDHVVSRIAGASPRSSHVPLEQELRGNIEQMPMVDLIQLLTMNRRSGVLGITTAHGAGEVRLKEGEVTEAGYRRLQGEKAFYRMLGEREGRFAFSPAQPGEAPAAPAPARRLALPTSALLMEAMRHVDEVQRRRGELALAAEAIRCEAGPLPPELPAERAAVARDVAGLLSLPRGLDDLLDEHPATDLAVLEALVVLDAAGRLRRVPLANLTTPFAPAEQLPVLRSLVTRLTRAGFAPPPRLVIAAGARRMPALALAIRRIADAVAPSEQLPAASLPRLLGTLRLGDGVDLALTGLPVDDASAVAAAAASPAFRASSHPPEAPASQPQAFAPTWALALPGAAAVVRVGGAGGPALEAHCEAVEVMLIDAERMMGSVDTTAPAQVAALVRSALEMAAGV